MRQAANPIKYHNKSLQRGLHVLECLDDADSGLTAAEVARRTGLHRATAHRFLADLCQMGYAHKNNITGAYWVGFNAARFGLKARILQRVIRQARPSLRALASETGATVLLGSLEGSQICIVDKVRRGEAPKVEPKVGDYVDAHATALGKVLLALKPETDVVRTYAEAPPRLHTRRTIIQQDALVREFRLIRKRRWAVEDEEHILGFRSIAVALINPAGRATCAVAVFGGKTLLPPARDAAVGVRVVASAAAIVKALTEGPS